jgi:F-type H+-transporting ATPase subunit delta
VQPGSPEIELYADSLLALARAADAVPRLEKDLGIVLDLVRASEPLRRFLADPLVNGEGKSAALQGVLPAGIHPLIGRFLLILLDQGRLRELPAVAEAFCRKAAGLRQELSGELVSPVELPAGKVAAIEAEVDRIMNRKVHLLPRVDPGMLGGVLVRVGSFVLDGTVDSRLEKFRRSLTA